MILVDPFLYAAFFCILFICQSLSALSVMGISTSRKFLTLACKLDCVFVSLMY